MAYLSLHFSSSFSKLDNESKRHAMRKRAYLFGRAMIWPQVAQHYMASFERARALIVSTHLAELELGNGEALTLASRYLAFIGYAFNHDIGRFRNFMDYQRHWLEESGSEDSHCRTLWALGTVLGRSNTPALQSSAGWLFEQALPAILNTTARRAFEWFLGRNDLDLPLYDPTTGGCRDGLHPDRPNENQGTESTLAFLQTLLELRLAENPLLAMETQTYWRLLGHDPPLSQRAQGSFVDILFS
jgi:hypothetical protein